MPKHISTLALLSLLSWSILLPQAACQRGYKDITALEALELLHAEPTTYVLDVGFNRDYGSGHIPGAYHIPHDEVEARIGELPKDRNAVIIVYCRSGVISSQASSTIGSHGYKNVYNMAEGFDVWKSKGFPVLEGYERGEFKVQPSFTPREIGVLGALELLHADPTTYVLDVRTLEEYVVGHIPGAYHIPHDKIKSRQDELPQDKNDIMIVYCKSGVRSFQASAEIAGYGYSAVYNMVDGFDVWKSKRYPVLEGYERGEFQIGEALSVAIIATILLELIRRRIRYFPL